VMEGEKEVEVEVKGKEKEKEKENIIINTEAELYMRFPEIYETVIQSPELKNIKLTRIWQKKSVLSYAIEKAYKKMGIKMSEAKIYTELQEQIIGSVLDKYGIIAIEQNVIRAITKRYKSGD